MKETFYFSHDYNVRADEKIKRLIRSHGIEGYGIYWAIVEDLYNNANALRTDYDGIAYDLRVDTTRVESIIKNFKLFEINEDYFSSISIAKRLEKRHEKSAKAKDSANKRWNKNANAMPTQSDSNAIKESKGKEIKINIDSNKLLSVFNSIFGKRARVVPDKAKKQINDRLKEGYTKEDIVSALENAAKDQHHIDSNYKYLTLEFITRPDKLERFVNMSDFKVKTKIL
tara:strand:- start:4832 stop:5515 length:684 start_codon:yes stop_codon:yes gene_type:complete